MRVSFSHTICKFHMKYESTYGRDSRSAAQPKDSSLRSKSVSLSLSYLFIILSGRVLFLELKRIHTYTRRHGVGPDNFVLEKKEEPPQHGFLS